MSNLDGKRELERLFYSDLYSLKSPLRKNLTVQVALDNMRMPELLCKQVVCCVCPVNDTDTAYANRMLTLGVRNIQCETSTYEYTG